MVRALVELTRAFLGQSAQALSVGDKMETHISVKHGDFADWLIGGVTMEINSPNWQEIHWISRILRQGMVVARQAAATEYVVQWRHIFFIWYGTHTGFSLVRKPIPNTGARG